MENKCCRWGHVSAMNMMFATDARCLRMTNHLSFMESKVMSEPGTMLTRVSKKYTKLIKRNLELKL